MRFEQNEQKKKNTRHPGRTVAQPPSCVFWLEKRKETPPDTTFSLGDGKWGDFPVILSFDCVKNYSIGYPRRKEAKFMNYRQENTDKIVWFQHMRKMHDKNLQKEWKIFEKKEQNAGLERKTCGFLTGGKNNFLPPFFSQPGARDQAPGLVFTSTCAV